MLLSSPVSLLSFFELSVERLNPFTLPSEFFVADVLLPAVCDVSLTPAFNLPCRFVLHTVGPIVTGRVTRQDRALLASCYRSCLQLAAEHGLESVAFCCISTGEFHFPNELAAEIAVQTVKEFLVQDTSVRKVIFNVFKDLDYEIYRRLLGAG